MERIVERSEPRHPGLRAVPFHRSTVPLNQICRPATIFGPSRTIRERQNDVFSAADRHRAFSKREPLRYIGAVGGYIRSGPPVGGPEKYQRFDGVGHPGDAPRSGGLLGASRGLML